MNRAPLALLVCLIALLSATVCALPSYAQQGDDCAELRDQLRNTNIDESALVDALSAAQSEAYSQYEAVGRQMSPELYDADQTEYFRLRREEVSLQEEIARLGWLWGEAVRTGTLPGDGIDTLSCDDVRAIVGKLGQGRAPAPKTQISLPTAAEQILQTFGPAVGELSDRPIAKVWKRVYDLYDKADTARTVVSFLVNPSADTGSELLATLVTERVSQAAIPIEIVKRLGKDTVPEVYKALFDEVMQVMADPAHAADAQRTFLERVQGEFIKAYSLGIIEPTPEAARAAAQQNLPLRTLGYTYGVEQGVRAYLTAAASPSRFTDIAGDPDPAAALFPPEKLALALPAQAFPIGVDLYGKGAADARVVVGGDGRIEQVYADLNDDGNCDWVESYDANGAPQARGLDTNADGKVDVVYERVGGAKHFTHVFMDSDYDGHFDSVAESTQADGNFDQQTSDTDGNGAADTTEIRKATGGTATVLRDANRDQKLDSVTMSGVSLGESGTGWSVRAVDANGNGYFERLVIWLTRNPLPFGYLDVEETGTFSARLRLCVNGVFAACDVDRNRDGIEDTMFLDSDADGRFEKEEGFSYTGTQRENYDPSMIEAALRALVSNEGWVTAAMFPKAP